MISTSVASSTRAAGLYDGMVFGNTHKTEYDARQGQTYGTKEIFQNPANYSFVHNFKVHYKRGSFQAIASKLEVSITSSNPQLPSTQLVTDEFNKRMDATIPAAPIRERNSNASFHITNVEYKESMAMSLPQMSQNEVIAPASPTTHVAQATQQPNSQVTACPNCGGTLSAGSRFCNKCGTAVA